MEKQNWLTRFLRIIFLIVFIIIGIIFFTKQVIPDKELMVSMVSIILLFVIGGIFIVFGLILDYNSKKNAGLCYLGIFSVIAAIWQVCELDLKAFCYIDPSMKEIIASFALMLIPIPKMLFLNDLMKYQYQKIYNSVIGLALLNTAISLVVTGMGWISFTDLRVTSHIIILLTGAVCLGCFFQYARTQKFAAPKAIAAGIASLVVSVLVEYINFIFVKAIYPGKYVGYGILFFLLMLGYATIKNWVLQWQAYQKTMEENNFKNTFLAGMSHEIKTPINTILGMNEMISRDSEEEAIKGYANHIHEAGELLLSMVNNVLDYTKIEAGGMKIIPVQYETGKLLSNLINSVNAKMDEKKLRFDIDVDEDIPCTLCGDELRISQAVMNLLTNALKYTNEGSILLKVRGERKSQKKICLNISVSDTGIGIRKKDQKRLFDSFVRIEEKNHHGTEGAGLGMTITRQIMGLMQGRVEMVSEYGKGSTFTLIFEQNVVENTPIGHFEDWYRTTLNSGRYQEFCYQATNVRILTIDDNEMNLEVIRGLLKNTGAWIDTAFSGEEGIAKAKSTEYDMILLDHMMPKMDGIETLRHLQQIIYIKDEQIPIIALTANADFGDREEYIQKGFTDYIAKPVDFRTLITMLKKYLPERIEKCPKIPDKQSICEEYLEEQGIHVKESMKYVGDEFEQYIHLLELFSSERGEEKEKVLQQAYHEKNWKDYTIYVHGLKNEARTIGADKLADMAYKHEQKSKEGDIAFLLGEYDSLIQEWAKTREIITTYLNTYYYERKEQLRESINAQELGEGEMEESLEQIISLLEGYKKKEALILLTKLSENRLVEEKRHNIERAIEAVQGYDYECAIQILKEM